MEHTLTHTLISWIAAMLSGIAIYILSQQVGIIRPIQWGDVYLDSVLADQWTGAKAPKK